MTWRRLTWILCLTTACGSTAAVGASQEGGGTERAGLTDDPDRARRFQSPLDIFVRPLDRALTDVVLGAEPAEAFAEIALTDSESLASLATDPDRGVEVGALEMVIRVVKDRGPPESERWEQTTLEVTAVRVGGIFLLTALHSEIRRLAEAPPESGEVPQAWSEPLEALLEGFAGPSCRFLPRLREADMRGLYDDAAVASMVQNMPDQARVDRTCSDWWDRTPRIRSLEMTGATIHRVDADRRVVGRLDASLSVSEGAITFGPLRSSED